MLDENANEESSRNGRYKGRPLHFFPSRIFHRASRLRRSREIPGQTADDKENLRIAEIVITLEICIRLRDVISVVRVIPRGNVRREIGNRRRLVMRFTFWECSRNRRNKSSCHIAHLQTHASIAHIHVTHVYLHLHPPFTLISASE